MSFQLKYINDETGEVTHEYNSEKYIVNGNCNNFTAAMGSLNLGGTCTVENLNNEGTVIPAEDEETEVKGYKFTYVVDLWRAEKKLPFFITSKLNGFASTLVEHIN